MEFPFFNVKLFLWPDPSQYEYVISISSSFMAACFLDHSWRSSSLNLFSASSRSRSGRKLVSTSGFFFIFFIPLGSAVSSAHLCFFSWSLLLLLLSSPSSSFSSSSSSRLKDRAWICFLCLDFSASLASRTEMKKNGSLKNLQRNVRVLKYLSISLCLSPFPSEPVSSPFLEQCPVASPSSDLR